MRATETTKRLWPFILLCALTACGGSSTTNPITGGGAGSGSVDSGDADTEDDNSGFNADITPPPGTADPTPGNSITRTEPTADGQGDGFVTTVSYDGTADTFSVDNLAFDGVGAYARDDEVPGNNAVFPFAVYESPAQTTDFLTGTQIPQFQHKAIYAVSASGQSKFAIVRTGGYLDYGFGGFLYQRDGAVTLPTEGQARFTGGYMGLRDFDGQSGLEYTVGEMLIDIDFSDFNDGAAVRGGVTDRRIFDTAGNEITQDVLDAINTANGTSLTELPVIVIDVTNGAVTVNGEATGTVQSTVAGSTFEEGKYYAVISGTDASEVVGIVAVTSEDPRTDGVTVRETGGFIVTR